MFTSTHLCSLASPAELLKRDRMKWKGIQRQTENMLVILCKTVKDKYWVKHTLCSIIAARFFLLIFVDSWSVLGSKQVKLSPGTVDEVFKLRNVQRFFIQIVPLVYTCAYQVKVHSLKKGTKAVPETVSFQKLLIYLFILFSHLADAFIQSDLQMRTL